MSDPGSSLTRSLHKGLAQATHLLDDNIKIVQFGIYGVAAVGVWRVLHSARAFSLFTRVEDIPHDFIRKNVRLSGRIHRVSTDCHIRSVSNSPTSSTTSRFNPKSSVDLLNTRAEAARLTSPSGPFPAGTLKAVTSAPDLRTALSNGDTTSGGTSIRSFEASQNITPQEQADSVSNDRNTGAASAEPLQGTSTSKDEEITIETIAEEILTDSSSGSGSTGSGDSSSQGTPANVGENTGDVLREHSDLSNTEYRSTRGVSKQRSDGLHQEDGYQDMGDLKHLFIEVQHVPVFRLPHHRPDQLLSIKLAAVEVPAATSTILSDRLVNKRMWFRLLYVDSASRALVCAVTRNQFGFGAWRTLNEEIIRAGEGIVSRFADVTDALPLTPSLTLRQRASSAFSSFWSGAPSAGSLTVADEQEGRKVLPVIPHAYHKLYGKLLQSEERARKKRLGVWREVEGRGGMERSFLVRLWNRFRNNTREMRKKD